MGMVVKVVDRALDNEIIALKILYPHLSRDRTQFGRFRNEVLVARKLAHPNIVRLYDFGAAGKGYYFISMEFVEGGNLGQRIYGMRQERLSFSEIRGVLYEICQGLACAHRQGVVHRDLKPDNILLGEASEVKLSDFGLARSLVVDKGFTETGETVGTPYYMAPEQLRGERLDPRVDIYSLGILAYEMAVGRRPFYDDNYMNLARLHFKEPIPDFASKESGIPLWFEKLVQKCAAKDREDRYENADAISKELLDHAKLEESRSIWSLPAVLSAPRAKKSEKNRWRFYRVQGAATLIVCLLIATAICLVRENQALKQEVAGLLMRTEKATGFDLSAVEGAIEGQLDSSDFLSSIVQGNRRAVEQLLSAGEEADAKDQSGTPALTLAVKSGSAEVVKLLLNNGANPNARDAGGRTPLMYAARLGFSDVIHDLISFGASALERDPDSNSPLLLAIQARQVDAAAALIEAGAPVNVSDNLDRSSLHWAVLKNELRLVKLLIQANADVNAKDRQYRVPAELAKQMGLQEISRLISAPKNNQ
jgi:hypothetical protein